MRVVMPRHPEHNTMYREWLQILRAECGEFERGISEYKNIAAYLNELGLRTGKGNLISDKTVIAWHRKRGLPVCVIRRNSGATTTNLLLLAWLASYDAYRRSRSKRRRCARWESRA